MAETVGSTEKSLGYFPAWKDQNARLRHYANEDNTMTSSRGPLVLAIADTALRSILSARLGMAGQIPISTTDHQDPCLRPEIRSTALLIIDETMIGSGSLDWTETLRNQCWSGQIIIVADAIKGRVEHDETVLLVDRRDASVAIPALVQLWLSHGNTSVNHSE